MQSAFTMEYVINFHTFFWKTDVKYYLFTWILFRLEYIKSGDKYSFCDVDRFDPEADEATVDVDRVDPEAEELSFENYTTWFKSNLKEGEGTLQVQTVISSWQFYIITKKSRGKRPFYIVIIIANIKLNKSVDLN